MRSRWGAAGLHCQLAQQGQPDLPPPTAWSLQPTASPRHQVSRPFRTRQPQTWAHTETFCSHGMGPTSLRLSFREIEYWWFAGDDETSSRHRPLPAPEDPVLPSPMRFPLPSSIGEVAATSC